MLFYYAGVGHQRWEPFTCDNAGFFYDQTFHFSRIIGRLSKLTMENPSYIEGHFFSSKTVQKDTLHQNFVQHESYTLRETLNSLLELNQEITQQTKASKKLEPNRKGTFILLDLEVPQLTELKDKSVERLLTRVLEESGRNRIYLFLFAQKAKDVPVSVQQSLSWGAYLESENRAYAKGLFKQEEDIFNENRRTIGVLRRTNAEMLIPINETSFEPSEYKHLSDTHLAVEDEAYRRFLNGLQ